MKLPATVFASELETDVGLLNRAVPLRGENVCPQTRAVSNVFASFRSSYSTKVQVSFILCKVRGVLLGGIHESRLYIFYYTAGPQLDWDPDVVAGLDEDFDFDNPENLLEDDFIIQAMDGEVEYHEEEGEDNERLSHQK